MENRSYTINHEDATVSLYEDSKGVMKELLRLGYRKFILERDFKGKSMFTADFSNLGPVMFMSREGRYVRAQISERIIPGDVWVVDPYNEWWWEKRSVRSITAEEFKDYTPPKVVGPVQVPVLVSSTEDLLEALTRGDSYIKVSSGTHLVLTKDMSNYFNIYIDVTLAEVIDPTGLVGLALASWKFLLCAEAMDSWIFSTFKSIVRATFTYSEEQFMASMAEKPTTCSAPVAEETLMPEVVPQPGYTPEKPQDASCEPWEPDTDTVAYSEPEADTEPHRPLDVVKEAFAKLEEETLSYGALADRMNQETELSVQRNKSVQKQIRAVEEGYLSANKSYRDLNETFIKESAGFSSEMVSAFDYLSSKVEEYSISTDDLSNRVRENERLLDFSCVLIILMAFNTLLNWLI